MSSAEALAELLEQPRRRDRRVLGAVAASAEAVVLPEPQEHLVATTWVVAVAAARETRNKTRD